MNADQDGVAANFRECTRIKTWNMIRVFRVASRRIWFAWANCQLLFAICWLIAEC